jgi:hypothetical protein
LESTPSKTSRVSLSAMDWIIGLNYIGIRYKCQTLRLMSCSLSMFAVTNCDRICFKSSFYALASKDRSWKAHRALAWHRLEGWHHGKGRACFSLSRDSIPDHDDESFVVLGALSALGGSTRLFRWLKHTFLGLFALDLIWLIGICKRVEFIIFASKYNDFQAQTNWIAS